MYRCVLFDASLFQSALRKTELRLPTQNSLITRRWFSQFQADDRTPISYPPKPEKGARSPKLSKKEKEIITALRGTLASSPSQLLLNANSAKSKIVDSTLKEEILNGGANALPRHLCESIRQAIDARHTDCVQNLIMKNSLGESPLTVALLARDSDYALELIGKGADVNWVNSKGSTPLHLCCNIADVKVFRALLQKGADVNAADHVGHTPLHLAVTTDSEEAEMVRELLSRGANVNAQTDEGHSALHYAATHGNKRVFELIVNAPKIDLELLDRDSNTVLHHLANDERDDLIPILLRKNPKLNLQVYNMAGACPLHLAAQNDSAACAIELLKAGANASVAEADGTTAAIIAASKGNLELLKMLRQYGADLLAKTIDGDWSALHAAAQAGHAEVVAFLLLNGAKPDEENEEGTTPLHLAVDGGHEKAAIELLKYGADANRTSHLTGTALHQAAQEGSRELVIALVQHGASLNTTNVDGFTSLHLALESGHEELAIEMLRLGANPNIASLEGFTAAHVAAQDGQLEVLKALAAHGADLNRRSKKGTPLRFARENGHEECVEFLKKMLVNQRIEDDEAPLEDK